MNNEVLKCSEPKTKISLENPFVAMNIFFVLNEIQLNTDILYVVTSLIMIVFRLLAVKNKWYLPSPYKE